MYPRLHYSEGECHRWRPPLFKEKTKVGDNAIATEKPGPEDSDPAETDDAKKAKEAEDTTPEKATEVASEKATTEHPASIMAILDMLVAASSKLLFCVTVHLALILQTQSVSMQFWTTFIPIDHT